jgi:hypothetical protein
MVDVVKYCLVQKLEDDIVKALEVFDDLVELSHPQVVQSLPPLASFMLEIAANSENSPTVRTKALLFIEYFATRSVFTSYLLLVLFSFYKHLRFFSRLSHACLSLFRSPLPTFFPSFLPSPLLSTSFSPPSSSLSHLLTRPLSHSKAMIRHNLILPTLQAIFKVCSTPDEDEDEELLGSLSCHRAGAQALDVIAVSLPTKHVFQPAIQGVETFIVSQNPYERRAALAALAVLAEGCLTKMLGILDTVLQKVLPTFSDPERIVREAACLVISHFSRMSCSFLLILFLLPFFTLLLYFFAYFVLTF